MSLLFSLSIIGYLCAAFFFWLPFSRFCYYEIFWQGSDPAPRSEMALAVFAALGLALAWPLTGLGSLLIIILSEEEEERRQKEQSR